MVVVICHLNDEKCRYPSFYVESLCGFYVGVVFMSKLWVVRRQRCGRGCQRVTNPGTTPPRYCMVLHGTVWCYQPWHNPQHLNLLQRENWNKILTSIVRDFNFPSLFSLEWTTVFCQHFHDKIFLNLNRCGGKITESWSESRQRN